MESTNEKRFFVNFVVGIFNRFLIVLDDYLKLNDNKYGLVLKRGADLFGKISLGFLPLSNKKTCLIDYFFSKDQDFVLNKKY